MLFYGIYPKAEALVLIPLLLLLMIITTLGVSLWLSGLNVRYRDVRYIVPFLLQIWMFATPVVYSSNELSGLTLVVYNLNPMTSVVEGFRWALTGGAEFSVPLFGLSTAVALILLLSGIIYFQRAEGTFADTA